MNKTRKIEITVELIRIVAAVAIAYAIALLTLVVFSDNPVQRDWHGGNLLPCLISVTG